MKCDRASYDVRSRRTAMAAIRADFSTVAMFTYSQYPCGVFVSNCFWSNGAIGILGDSGPADGAAAGSTMVGVTITINSEFVLFTDLDRNSCPKIGRSPMPGTLANCAVVL